jgi:alkylhydroperoxidase family enzyme
MQTQIYHPVSAPLLTPQTPAGDEARVAAIFKHIEDHVGFVPDGLRLYSVSPPLLETFVGNIGYFDGGGTGLPPELTAMIRYLVSWQAGCSFCVDMNEGFLANMGKDLDAVRAARNNPDLAPLSEQNKILLKLALKAVNSPEFVNQADLDLARAQGWSDRDVFDAVAQAANNRAFNLILRTFKIEHQGAFA